MGAAHAIGARAAFRGDHFMNFAIDIMHASPIFDGDTRGNLTGAEQFVIGRPALGFAVEMWTAAAWQKAEPSQRPQAVGQRIGQPCLEPPNRAGAESRQTEAGLPGF